MLTPLKAIANPRSRATFGVWLRRRGSRHAGTPAQRRELLSEVAELDSWLAEKIPGPGDRLDSGLDQRAELRRTRHVIALVPRLIDAHPVDGDNCCTRCSRRGQECPVNDVLRTWIGSWAGTGGLAERREGDPSAVSTRRLQ
ncbi:hypothetical protein GCM10027456_81760 [Kineosporia babensis]